MRKLLLSIGLTLLFFQMLNSQAAWRYRYSGNTYGNSCSGEDDRSLFRLAGGILTNADYQSNSFVGDYMNPNWASNEIIKQEFDGCGNNPKTFLFPFFGTDKKYVKRSKLDSFQNPFCNNFPNNCPYSYYYRFNHLNYFTYDSIYIGWEQTSLKPTKIFFAVRDWCCGQGDIDKKFFYPIAGGYASFGEIAHNHDDGRIFIDFCETQPIINLNNTANNTTPINPNQNNTNICSKNNFTLQARTGFSSYQWYYNVNGQLDSSFSIIGGWKYFKKFIPIPAQTGSLLNVNYSELAELHTLPNGGLGSANVLFRCMVDGQPEPSLDGETTLPITFYKATPDVTHHVSTPTSCYYNQDGTASLYLSRPLNAGEYLNLTLWGTVDTSGNGTFVNYAIANQTYYPHQIGAGNSVSWNNLAPGSYSLTVEGWDNGLLMCNTNVYNFNITRPDPLDFSLSKTDYTCYQAHNGIIDVTATGGNGGYQYQLDNGSYQSSNQFTGVMLGNRSITVKDNKGCFRQSPLLPSPQNSKSITINQPDSLQMRLDSMRHPLGYDRWDGFIRMTALGGTTPYTYTWSNGFVGANNINLPDGLYRVDLSDAKGCSQWDTIRMIQPDPLIGDVDTLIKIKCRSDSNGSIIVNTEGGVRPYFYLWNTGHTDSVVHDLPRGTYTVTITDINGNDTTASINLGDPDTLAISEVISPASCAEKADGAIDISPSGGTMPYRYQWIFGDTTQDIINIQAGNYFITMLDSQDCKFEKSFVVRAPNALEATPELVHPTCYQGRNGHITLQTKGGTPPYSYLWTNTNSTTNMAKDLKQGTYASTVTDAQNCQFVNQTALTHPPQIELSIPRNSYTLCDGQELILDGQQLAEPNVLYEWTSDRGFQSSQQRVTLIDSAIYTLNVTNQKGCKRAASFQIYRSNAKVESIFLVASSAYNDTSIIALNIGKEYDRVAWKFPPSARVDSTSDSLAIFKLSQNGEYALGLTAFKGQCEAYTEKNILVVSRPVLIDQDSVVSTSVVDSLEVFPNPNNGQFSIKIRLFERADVNLRIVGMLSSQVMAQQLLSGESKYDVPMDITAMASGVYMLIVETKREKHLVRIVKQ